jgi:hypothetical protein
MPPKKPKNPIPKVQINALYAKYINNGNQQDTNLSRKRSEYLQG